MTRAAYLTACISLIALIFLGIAWELRLAPLRPGGSALVFKVLPLLAPLFGILHGKRYTYKWSSLLILVYFAEGLVRGTTEAPPARWLAIAEIALAATFFAAAVTYVRGTRNQ
ncbi:MAG: DUF2069 domain-containing protein [Rhodocyclales bacterium]|nr:DUF2069 domain-containing protein [Rhodocyclales bacterium]